MRQQNNSQREKRSAEWRYIVSQRLVSKLDGRRLLVTEIMGSSLRIRFRNTAAPSIELLTDQSEARRFKSLDEVVKSISRWS